MGKTFTEKAKIVKQLIKLRKENTIIFHYACESFGTGDHLMSISTFEISTRQARSFSVHNHCKGQPRKTIKLKYDDFEREMLTDFAAYIEEKKDYNWVGWNVKNDRFGLQHIYKRIKILCGIDKLPELKLHDLSHTAWELYGDDYVPYQKLLSLILLNQISKRDFKDGKEEGKLFSKYSYKIYSAINMSVLRKVETISIIMEKMADESIKVHPNEKEIIELKTLQIGRLKAILNTLMLLIKIFRLKIFQF